MNRIYHLLLVTLTAITLLAVSAVPPNHPISSICFATCTLNPHKFVLTVRGGSDDDSSDSESNVETDSEEGEISDDNSSFLVDTLFGEESVLLNVGKKVLVITGKLALSTLKVVSRTVAAAFHSTEELADEEQDEDGPRFLTKVSRVLKRMVNAAFMRDSEFQESVTINLSTDIGTDSDGILSLKSNNAKMKAKVSQPDFGIYLSKIYGIEATRDELEIADRGMPILGGTISDALRIARSKARLLVVTIPASKPGKAQQHDEEAIKSVLSAEVATVAERKARKSGESGSFVIWGAKAGSAEAVTALKRLKATQTNSKGQRRCILVVAYPAQVVGSDGKPKIVPRLLAQHHCSPPPSPEMMAAWLNALRKRHAQQYATMQLELKEAQFHIERKEGYKGSVERDRVRQQREEKEMEERRKLEATEKEQLLALEQRREGLRQSLPDEPPKEDPTAKTIAVRLSDGRSSQRRFPADSKMATMFNWVDVTFDLERENLVLTTLNGQMSFEWEQKDSTLSEAGLGRMAGFRVSEKNPEVNDQRIE
jgi:hypothetical protein